MNTDLISYYKKRAGEYEKIYSKPERQHDLKAAALVLQQLFAGKKVLEIACGTGYWTEHIATTAETVYATDINETVIEIAKQRSLPPKVKFDLADIYNFPHSTKFQSLFGGFIWSHIPLQELDKFISIVNNLVEPGGTVVFMDNNYIEGSNTPLSKTDEQGNTYQTRKLEDGTNHLVLKNFPNEMFLRNKLSYAANDFEFFNFNYFWIVKYNTL